MPVDSRALEPLFSPRRIAVVGGSDRPGSVGEVVLRNLREGGYRGEIFVVNRGHARVQGLASYARLTDVPGPIDLALIAVPAGSLSEVVADAGVSGVRSALVFSAGFAELGQSGAERQRELAMLARNHGVRLMGPNSVGLVRPSANLQAFFGRTRPRSGRLALVSQSGAVCTAVTDWAEAQQLGFSLVASLGGAADIEFGDVLDYLALDAQTDAVVVYIEGVAASQARSFLSGLRAAARAKPVVVLKAGRAEAGSKAAVSHTGALAGDDVVFDAALRRCGAVRVSTLEQLFAAAALLARGKRTAGDRLALVTNAGGLGVMAADHVAEQNIHLAELSVGTLRALDAALPAHWSHGNPVDIIGDASPERYRAALTAVLEDPAVDAAAVLLSPQAMTAPSEVAKVVLAANELSAKPVLACFMGGAQVRDACEELSRGGVPVLASPETTVNAFAYLAELARNQRSLLRVPEPVADRAAPDVAAARNLVRKVLAGGRTLLSAAEANELVSYFGVEVVASIQASTAEEAWQAAERVGLPVAMKIDSPEITHKSDVDGVALNLGSRQEVQVAFAQMMHRVREKVPGASLRGVTVGPMRNSPTGREVLVGLVRDRSFGPAIMVGAGGVLVELVADRSVELPPLDADLARGMVDRTRIKKLLGPYRGMPPANRGALERVLLALSDLASELPEIRELDINPLVVDEHSAVALDARVVVDGEPRPTTSVSRYAHMAIEPYPAHLARSLRLADGTSLRIRPIRPEDGENEQSFVQELSSEARQLRFHHGLSSLTPAMLVRFTQIDYDREMAFVALVDVHGVEKQIGVARYVTDANELDAEFAVVVADAWHGRGVATALMQALIERARDKGTRALHGDVLATNGKMLKLVRALGFQVVGHPEDAKLCVVTLPLSTPARPECGGQRDAMQP